MRGAFLIKREAVFTDTGVLKYCSVGYTSVEPGWIQENYIHYSPVGYKQHEDDTVYVGWPTLGCRLVDLTEVELHFYKLLMTAHTSMKVSEPPRVSCLTSPKSNVSCLKSPVSCLQSHISYLMSSVSCLLSYFFCLMSPVFCLMSSVSHLLSHVSCLTSPVS